MKGCVWCFIINAKNMSILFRTKTGFLGVREMFNFFYENTYKKACLCNKLNYLSNDFKFDTFSSFNTCRIGFIGFFMERLKIPFDC